MSELDGTIWISMIVCQRAKEGRGLQGRQQVHLMEVELMAKSPLAWEVKRSLAMMKALYV